MGCPRCSPDPVGARAHARGAKHPPVPSSRGQAGAGPGSGSQRHTVIISLAAPATINNCFDAFECWSGCEASAALPGGTGCAVASIRPGTALVVPGRAEATTSTSPGARPEPSPTITPLLGTSCASHVRRQGSTCRVAPMGAHSCPAALPQAVPRAPAHPARALVGPSWQRRPPAPPWAEPRRGDTHPPSGWLVITDGICMETGCFYSSRLHLLLLKSPRRT